MNGYHIRCELIEGIVGPSLIVFLLLLRGQVLKVDRAFLVGDHYPIATELLRTPDEHT